MDNKVIDVNFTELDDRDYFTIEEVAQKIDVDMGKIIFWCNKFEDLLKINSIGQFKIFSREDVRNLKTIKELNIDQKMSVSEVRQYLNQHTTAIVVKKEKELDLSIFNFFTNIIETQNKKLEMQNQKMDQLLEIQTKQVKMFAQVYNEISIDALEKNKLMNKIIDEQHKQKNAQEVNQRELKEYVTSTITDTIDNSLNSKLSELAESITEFKSHIDEREMEYQRKNLEEIDRMRNNMENMKKKYEQEQQEQKNKGFFSWLRKK